MASEKREAPFAKQNNRLKFTKFKPLPQINQKNYYTDYLKRDSQLLVNREPSPAVDQQKIIVCSPGSRNLHIGNADDASPLTLPMVIARKNSTAVIQPAPLATCPDFDEAFETVEQDFVERMRYYKRKVEPDATEQITDFNKRQAPQPVQGENHWITEPDVAVCDTKVDPALYTLFWPIQHGSFNERYASTQYLYEDLRAIFEFALGKLEVKPGNASQYSIMLVIRDLYEQTVVNTLIEILLKHLGIGRVAIIQEGVAATFGIGLSSACIVNVGAQTTSISCVDEGLSIVDSRVDLRYGGDDVTRALVDVLARVEFPVKLDVSSNVDFVNADELKCRVCTANDETLAIQLESFTYKRPGKIEKYAFKIYEQAMLPILGLFYPQLFESPATKMASKYRLVPQRKNIYDGRYDDPVSDAMINVYMNTLGVFGESYSSKVDEKEKEEDDDDEESRQATPFEGSSTNGTAASTPKPPKLLRSSVLDSIDLKSTAHVALDHAIIESIQQTAKKGLSQQQFFTNILVIGGGAKFPLFDVLLADRLQMWTKKTDLGAPSIVAIPKELDAMTVAWKGAAVYCRLKIVEEMWVEAKHWEVLGSRVLQYKTLFGF